MKSIAKTFFILILTFGVILAQSNKKPFQLKDLRKLVNISDPQISPDGSRIAVIISKPDWKKDKNIQKIDLVNIADGSIRSITYKRENISNLKWSPDGKDLAFLSKEIKTKKPQIYIMPMNGGDPICITKSKTGVSEFSWSPDGNTIAYVAQDTVPNPKQIKHHEDAFKVTDNNYTVRAVVQPWHLWIVPAKGGKAKQLTKGTKSICTDQETITPVAWSPDGKSIIFQQFPDVWEGNGWHSILAEVDTSGGKVKELVKAQGSGMPNYAPVGNVLAFMRPRNGDQNNGNAVYIKNDNGIKDATHELARNINSYIWMPDESVAQEIKRGNSQSRQATNFHI